MSSSIRGYPVFVSITRFGLGFDKIWFRFSPRSYTEHRNLYCRQVGRVGMYCASTMIVVPTKKVMVMRNVHLGCQGFQLCTIYDLLQYHYLKSPGFLNFHTHRRNSWLPIGRNTLRQSSVRRWQRRRRVWYDLWSQVSCNHLSTSFFTLSLLLTNPQLTSPHYDLSKET